MVRSHSHSAGGWLAVCGERGGGRLESNGRWSSFPEASLRHRSRHPSRQGHRGVRREQCYAGANFVSVCVWNGVRGAMFRQRQGSRGRHLP